MRGLWREIDIPPLWFAVHAALGWAVGRVLPVSLPGARAAAVALLVVGAVLFVAAIVQMRLRRTTVIPRRTASALVSDGVFALSRNPIYLADALLLAGLLLWWKAVLALPLVPVFIWLITRRYILAEEAGLRAVFGPAFDDYCARTRRWL